MYVLSLFKGLQGPGEIYIIYYNYVLCIYIHVYTYIDYTLTHIESLYFAIHF